MYRQPCVALSDVSAIVMQVTRYTEASCEGKRVRRSADCDKGCVPHQDRPLCEKKLLPQPRHPVCDHIISDDGVMITEARRLLARWEGSRSAVRRIVPRGSAITYAAKSDPSMDPSESSWPFSTAVHSAVLLP